MEALKKAEQAKQAAAAARPADEAPLPLEPAEAEAGFPGMGDTPPDTQTSPAGETPDASFPELSLDTGTSRPPVRDAEPPPVAFPPSAAMDFAGMDGTPSNRQTEIKAEPAPAMELALESLPPAAPETGQNPFPAPSPVKEGDKEEGGASLPPPPPPPSSPGSRPFTATMAEGGGDAAPRPPEPPAEASAPPPPREPHPAAPSPVRPGAPKRPEAAKQRARNVFAAKTGKPALSLSKPVMAAAAVGVALLAAGTGYYFYQELMNPPLLALQPGQPAPVAAPTAPAPAVAVAPAGPEAVSSLAEEPAPAQPGAGADSLPAVPGAPDPGAARSSLPAVQGVPMESAQTATPERGEIRIQRGTPAEQLNPHLTRGYQALQAGNYNEAQEAYRKVLQSDRNNRDALLGLAALQERKGDGEGAARLYQRLLELDPNDGAAQGGLTGLGEGDPVRAESRLKSLLSQQPDSDPLHFALGNLYAGQQRWAEAQQAYFRAFQKQPGNPDYLYNLAVSLDHLGQNKLARDYYHRALAASNRPHNFSPDEVRGRINSLEKATP